MKTKLLLIALLYLNLIEAQDLTINFQNKFGGSNIDVVYDGVLSPTEDGYYFVGGTRSSDFDRVSTNFGNSDVWVIKTDLNYQIEWEKSYGGSENETAKSIKIANNQIYILAESNSAVSGNKTSSNFGASDMWLFALNLEGDVSWQKNFGGSDSEEYSKMILLNDGNLLLGAISNSPVSGNKTTPVVGNLNDIWLVKVNHVDGEIINQKNIATNQYDLEFNIAVDPFTSEIYVMSDVVTGVFEEKTDAGYGQTDLWVAVLDAQLDVDRNKCFGGDKQDGSSVSVYFTENNVYFLNASNSSQSGNKNSMLNGTYNFTNYDYWLIKTDKNWNILWDVSYGGANTDIPISVYKGEHNTIAIAGNSKSDIFGTKTAPNYGMFDYWALLVDDTNGSLITQNSYGGNADDIVEGIVCTPSNDLLLFGYSDSGISGNKTSASFGTTDIWIVEAETTSILKISALVENKVIEMYPNPFKGNIHFDLSKLSESGNIKIFTLDGKKVYEDSVKPHSIVAWDSNLDPQIFIYQIVCENYSFTGKIVKQ